ncbi:hypothetical protein EVAR_23591_1 [Eumeta japonica]|uniref:Uncharacterized protein n=1 Tax=Eumeta variegata TaxID=151549 RepID=A0A4C1WZM2_EUMVA|nr:hypothetical protein EVAR_23591_1 [Eumeta japonica]
MPPELESCRLLQVLSAHAPPSRTVTSHIFFPLFHLPSESSLEVQILDLETSTLAPISNEGCVRSFSYATKTSRIKSLRRYRNEKRGTSPRVHIANGGHPTDE